MQSPFPNIINKTFHETTQSQVIAHYFVHFKRLI